MGQTALPAGPASRAVGLRGARGEPELQLAGVDALHDGLHALRGGLHGPQEGLAVAVELVEAPPCEDLRGDIVGGRHQVLRRGLEGQDPAQAPLLHQLVLDPFVEARELRDHLGALDDLLAAVVVVGRPDREVLQVVRLLEVLDEPQGALDALLLLPGGGLGQLLLQVALGQFHAEVLELVGDGVLHLVQGMVVGLVGDVLPLGALGLVALDGGAEPLELGLDSAELAAQPGKLVEDAGPLRGAHGRRRLGSRGGGGARRRRARGDDGVPGGKGHGWSRRARRSLLDDDRGRVRCAHDALLELHGEFAGQGGVLLALGHEVLEGLQLLLDGLARFGCLGLLEGGDGLPALAEGLALEGGVGRGVGNLGHLRHGGEALEEFLSGVPQQTGMAFVIVQHLDPTHKGIMPELLQRATAIKVSQAKDFMRVEQDHIYIIPPNKDMSILHGSLQLFDLPEQRGLRLPIDFFFRSLAEDLHEKSVGVILSGMGSDGTSGLRAIKEKGGLALVQDPSSAKFDNMPRSAIDAGLSDVVARPEQLPGKIISYFSHSLAVAPGLSLESKAKSALEKIIVLLRDHSGHDFSLYKKNTVYRRIERRMGIHQVDKISSYVRLLQQNPRELELLFKELLIGVTSFFRDPDAWKALKEKALPELLDALPVGRSLKAWVVGCSTGEEAYSLAILFREVMEEMKKPARRSALQIFATDIDRDAIERARQGIFPDNIIADVSPERLSRFFMKDDRGYRVKKEVRDMVVFAEQNVIMDPPFTKLDILTCRNLLIYLTPEVQKKILPLFHYSLNPGAILFLGNAETIGTFTDLFSSVEAKARLYKKLPSPVRMEPLDFPSSFVQIPMGKILPAEVPKPTVNLQILADRLILERHSPAAVLTNDKGDILYINGRTGKYLEPAAGKANWNIFAMAREGLRYELTGIFRKALLQKEEVVLHNIEVKTNGSTQTVDVSVQAVHRPEELKGTVVTVFKDVPSLPQAKPGKDKPQGPASRSAREGVLEATIQELREELQSTREEMQTSQEEAKSANEELQSTNEELQSTNEELTTSKEELQSLNEELQTVNAELQAKVDALTWAENDWENLLNSMDIATLFLDNDLQVRRFTARTTKLIKLIPGDVGRPITDLATDLDYREMAADAKKVLESLVFVEREVSTRAGMWLAARIMPYRTRDNRIDGVVITFTDISVAKELEARVSELKAAKMETNGEKNK